MINVGKKTWGDECAMADPIWLAVVFLVLARVFSIIGARGIAGFSIKNRKMAGDNFRYCCGYNIPVADNRSQR